MKPTVTVPMDDIHVLPGQTLTVWLGAFASRRSQVELRVTEAGIKQVFLDGEEVPVLEFEQWTSMEKVP